MGLSWNSAANRLGMRPRRSAGLKKRDPADDERGVRRGRAGRRPFRVKRRPERQRRHAGEFRDFAERFTPVGFSVTVAACLRGHDEFRLHLARAFDRAWKRYYRPSRIGAISESVARPALAKHLITSAKQGVTSLDALAEGGLLYLVSLTPEAPHWGRLRIEGAGARFQREWRIRLLTQIEKKKRPRVMR
jgi:hypothetical protein